MNEANSKAEAELAESRSKADRAAFHRAWADGLERNADMLSRLPVKSMAYEIAFRAFIAGRRSNTNP